jgi:hypothetical protein
VAGLAALLVVAYLAISAVRLLRVDHELRTGVASVSALEGRLHGSSLTSGSLDAPVAASAADFAAAAATMRSAWWDPLEVLPVAGRQLASLRALSAAAATTTRAGSAALVSVRALLAAPHATATERTALLGRLSTVTATLRDQLTGVRLGPSTDLVDVLAHERDTFATDLAKVDSGVERTSAATAAVSRLFEGPATYLVLAANNAEMRDGSGMALQVGTVTFDHGTVRTGTFGDSSVLSADQPPVRVTGDLEALWGQHSVGQEWRNLGLSPQFPLNAPVAASMWAARGGGRVDGVLELDVPALADLLGVTGPVTFDSLRYTSSTVDQQLLVDEYNGLSLTSQSANGARQQALGGLAAVTLGRLESAASSVGQLVDALAAAADGRHLMAWSADPSVEADWQASGVGGTLPSDAVLVGLLNEGANKLDPFQHLQASLRAVPSGADTAMTLTVRIHNEAPTWLSPYAGDGSPGPRLAYNGAFSLDVPAYAGHVSVSGAGRYQAAGSDGTTDQAAVLVSALPDGASLTVTVHFVLLGHHGTLQVQPSARVPATSWTWQPPGGGTSSFDDATAHLVTW